MSQSQYRRDRDTLEQDVLAAYNRQRRLTGQSQIECCVEVGRKRGLNFYQVQYVIIKARKAGKEVL